jgi:hypothetical protein
MAKNDNATNEKRVRAVSMKLAKNYDSAEIVGVCNKHKMVATQFGDAPEFHGYFGLRTPDGELFKASKAYFPAILSDEITTQLEDGAESVEIAVRLFKEESANSPQGYAWSFEQLIKASEDPVDSMLKKLPKALPNKKA